MGVRRWYKSQKPIVRVAAVDGTGPAALAGASTILERYGFRLMPRLPSNFMKFTGSVANPANGDRAARRRLIEVWIIQSGQYARVSNLVNAITMNVNKLLEARR